VFSAIENSQLFSEDVSRKPASVFCART